jgi:protein-disulfide isomerase
MIQRLTSRLKRALAFTAVALAATLPGRLSGQAVDQPLAIVDGTPIMPDEIDSALGPQLHKIQEQIHSLKRQRVEALIDERLLAKEAAARGISVPELLEAEVRSKAASVTEDEIETFYQFNKDRLQPEDAEIRPKIRVYLQNQRLTQRRQELLESLRKNASVTILLKPPPVLRVPIDTRAGPFKGPENAPVTIVEFSDFHCAFCKKALPTLAQLEARYSGRIRLVFRDFPIDRLHPGARIAHEAARCADDQGKFWPYHDKLFATAPKASFDDLTEYARALGLEVSAFQSCLQSGTHRAAVDRDIEQGNRAGVSGTPAFFINGRLIAGAQSFEAFARVIDEELARSEPSK